MKWIKQGRIFAPDGSKWWAQEYAMLPTADVRHDNTIRMYFASLDDQKFGRVGYIDLDANNPKRIIRESENPILDIGELGGFDDSGVNPSCIITLGDRKYLYYIGWQRCERIPYMLFSGLAISHDDGETFTKPWRIPVLDRTPTEPFSRSAPCILVDGNVFKIWYWSCEKWSNENGWIHYNNVIRYAESTDGMTWTGTDTICISPDATEDYSVGRPWVIKEQGLYKMWFSVRGKQVPYRIEYAESKDGKYWNQNMGSKDIQASDTGWDSEMICFPCVVDAAGKRYLFYNGNRHGSTGFGYAVLDA